MSSLASNKTFNPRVKELENFSFQKKMVAGNGVFEWHRFKMPEQIPGLKFSLRICRTVIKTASGQSSPSKLKQNGIVVNNISNYFSIQLCIEKGKKMPEEKMRSKLSGLKLRGTLMLTQTSATRVHTMNGAIFKPNSYEEHSKEVTKGFIPYGTYKYDPKSSRPAFTGWFFGTDSPTFTDSEHSHVVVDDTMTCEADVFRDFYTIGEVPNLKIEVSIHIH